MRNNPIFPVLFITLFILIIDFYTFKGIRMLMHNFAPKYKTIIYVLFWLVPVFIIAGSVLIFFRRENMRTEWGYNFFQVILGVFVLSYVPKLFFVVFHFTEDAIKVIAKLVSLPFDNNSAVVSVSQKISRTTFLSQLGLIIAAIPFVSIIWGILKGRFNFTVNKHKLYIKNLPKSFEGLRIAQISDLHIGSFNGHAEKVKAGIELLNEQKPDIIVFTGDMINNTADELDNWIDILGSLKAKYGKYSVLGNHDYGHYYEWKNEEEKKEKFDKLLQYQKEMGFELLRNDSAIIEKDGDKIAVVGVENWGKPPFPQYGDYEKAANSIKDIPFKVLLSHDPTHWDEKIMNKTDVSLTLSGHTHGMQFGINIPGLKWSPIKFRYPRWGGMYSEGNQHLHVSIGFGFIAFPGRVGTAPEIAVIDIYKKVKSEEL